MKSNDLGLQTEPAAAPATDANAASVGLADLLTWIGEGKRLIAVVTVVAALASLVSALRAPFIFTARTTFSRRTRSKGGARPRSPR